MDHINVEIFGIGSRTMETIHSMMESVLGHGYELTIKHIEDPDAMMEKKIGGIPAMSINGEVVFQEQLPSIDDLRAKVFSHLFSHSKPMIMKTILVPVDFSDPSKNAYRFALKYAQYAKAKIHLVHAYSSPLDSANPAVLLTVSDQEDRLTDALKKLADEKDSFGAGDVTVTYDAKLGFAVEEILKLSEDEHVDMIIMGTMGSHLAVEKVFGTVSTDVSQKAHCPVMLIPPEIEFKVFDDILFASDYSSAESNVLNQIMEFAKVFNSALHFVHVQTKDDFEISPEEMIFDKVFSTKDPQTPMYFAEIDSQSTTEGINRYVDDHEINLLVVVTQYRSFWERLFHQSTTKKLAFSTSIPLLVLHLKE